MRKLAPFILVVLIATYAWAVCSTPTYTVFNGSGGTVGVAPTPATLAASTHGSALTWTATTTAIRYEAPPASFPGFKSPKVASDGKLYTGNPSTWFNYSPGVAQADRILTSFNSGTVGAFGFAYSVTGNTFGSGDLCDCAQINSAGGLAETFQLTFKNSSLAWQIEGEATGTTTNGNGPIPLQNHTYFFTMTFSNGAPGTLATNFDLETNPPTQKCSTETTNNKGHHDLAPDNCSVVVPEFDNANPLQYSWGNQGSCATTKAGVFHVGPVVFDTGNPGGQAMVQASMLNMAELAQDIIYHRLPAPFEWFLEKLDPYRGMRRLIRP